MILAIDVQYTKTNAIVAGITFNHWPDPDAQKEYTSRVENVAAYEPGHFYKRELPCIVKLMAEHQLTPECVVIDGFVFLDGHSAPGLGKHLYEFFNQKIPVIGVAKKRFKDISSDFEVLRGKSKIPLFITSAGIDTDQAKTNIRNMHGQYRLPTLLKRVDQICRST